MLLSPLPTPGAGETFRTADSFVAICLRNNFSLVDTPHSGASALLVPVRCTLIFASQCPTPLCGVGHWRETGGSSCEDKSDSKIGCHIAQRRLPLFLNYPQRPFHLRASPTKPATPVIFAVRPVREANFVRFAMPKNVVGFVVIS